MSIEVRGLTLRYPGAASAAVAGLDLSIATGEIVTLLGPSGSGKSTTLRCIAGLERPTTGVIAIHGDPVCDSARRVWVKPERRNLGMVFQSYAVWPHLTVAENIGYPLKVRGRARAEIRRRVEETAALVALTPYLDRPATQLSGGQQQRVALARAIIAEPQAILFDEPLSNLDAKLRERMRREVRGLVRQAGLTAVYVTHDQEEAFAISDRIAVMENGKICQIGVPEEIYRRPASAYVADFVGAANLLDGTVADGRFVIPDLGFGIVVSASPGPARIAVRPEQVLLASAPAPGFVPAAELDREYLGGFVGFTLRAGSIELRAQVLADAAPAAGQALWLSVPATAAVFLGPAVPS